MAEESPKFRSFPTAGTRGLLGNFLVRALPLFLLACGGTDAESGSAGERIFDPRLPASAFQSEQDPAERDRIVGEMWTVLTRPQCWDASFIGPATPSGSAASVSQFTFSGQAQYRYYGFSIYSGIIGLQDVGHYKGKPSVMMSTWSGESEGLILVDQNHFEHVVANPSGAYYSVTFWTSNGPCL